MANWKRPLSCDVLVVGSGPPGSLSAYYLAKNGHDVIVAEEGPDTSKAPIVSHSSVDMNTWYRNAALTPCIGKNKISYAKARCLGGGSAPRQTLT